MSTKTYNPTLSKTSDSRSDGVRSNPQNIPRPIRPSTTEIMHDDDMFLPNAGQPITSQNKRPIWNEKDEETELKHSKAKMSGPNIQFTQTYEQFVSDEPLEIQNKHAPPYMPVLSDEKLTPMIEWERRKVEQHMILSKDKYYQWLSKVAGFTRTKFEELGHHMSGDDDVGPMNLNSNVFAPSKKITYLPDDISRTVDTSNFVETHATFDNTSYSSSRPIGMLTSKNPYVRQIGKQIVERNAQQQSTRWIERSDVIGTIELTPRTYGAMSKAIFIIHSWYPDTLGETKAIDYIESIDDDVSTAFAMLVGNIINGINYIAPTKNVLDKNFQKISDDQFMLLNTFRNFTVSQDGKITINKRNVQQSGKSPKYQKIGGFFLPPSYQK